MIKFIVAKNYDELSKKAAGIIKSVVVLNNDAVLGLATGSSPIGTYKELINAYKNNEVSFKNCISVNLDEYKGLDGENDQSYRYFMNDNLFNHIDIDKNNTFVPNGLNDATEECKAYDNLIDSFGGVDLQLLGLGLNGHIGFNEPADSFSMGTQEVALTESTIEANKRFFEKVEDVPKFAYTMGIGTIMTAKKVVLIASGAAKSSIVKQAFFGAVTPNVPASILQMHPDTTVILDEESATEILELI